MTRLTYAGLAVALILVPGQWRSSGGIADVFTLQGPIPIEPCNDCSLDLVATTSLSAPDDVAGLDLNSRIRRMTSGNFIAAPIAERGLLAVFNPKGRFMRTIGGAGEGPGEFRSISIVAAGVNNEVIVADWRLSRMSRLSLRGALLSSFPLVGRPMDVVPVPDDRLAVQMNIPTEETVGIPVHIMSQQGKMLASFGSEGVDYQAWNADVFARQLAYSNSGLWVSRLNEYQIELWSLEGKHLRTLVRKVEWFEPWYETNRKSFYDSRPETRVAGLAAGRDGLLWLLLTTADKDWRRGDPPDDITEIGLAEARRFYDWVIEVIDPSRVKLVAARRFDGVVQIVEPGLIARVAEESSGEIRFDLFTAIVRQP